jgi:hypothetical protein
MRFLIVTLGAALALCACATDDAAEEGDNPSLGGGADSTGPERMENPQESFNESDYSRRDLDLNADGKPDAYQFSFIEDGKRVVVRKEVDVNFDAKIDLIRAFNDKGDLLQEWLDTDFDKSIDVVNFFEKGKITRKEYDTNFDSNVDVWRYFTNGVIDRKEADLDHDGRKDYWEYYEGGKIDRVGVDRDGDGEVDEWEVANRDAG